jgi:hypothetical protein
MAKAFPTREDAETFVSLGAAATGYVHAFGELASHIIEREIGAETSAVVDESRDDPLALLTKVHDEFQGLMMDLELSDTVSNPFSESIRLLGSVDLAAQPLQSRMRIVSDFLMGVELIRCWLKKERKDRPDRKEIKRQLISLSSIGATSEFFASTFPLEFACEGGLAFGGQAAAGVTFFSLSGLLLTPVTVGAQLLHEILELYFLDE